VKFVRLVVVCNLTLIDNKQVVQVVQQVHHLDCSCEICR